MIRNCIWCDKFTESFYCERCQKLFDDLAEGIRNEKRR